MTTKQKRQLKATDIGRYFVYLANTEKKPITNKKLQKLVYYSQAWSLVLNDKKLFSEPIEAWVHGPAIRDLYIEYKKFGFNPIQEEIDQRSIKNISGKTKELLDEIWKVYGKKDASYLEMLTHSERPWQIAREGMQSYQNSANEITPKLMKAYYSERLKATKE